MVSTVGEILEPLLRSVLDVQVGGDQAGGPVIAVQYVERLPQDSHGFHHRAAKEDESLTVVAIVAAVFPGTAGADRSNRPARPGRR